MTDERKRFRTVGDAPPKTAAIRVPVDVRDKLETLAEELGNQFGFRVSVADTIAHLIYKHRQPTPAPPTPMSPAEVEKRKLEALHPALINLMRAGDKIGAIKLLRADTSMGLKDAKDYVEQRWDALYRAAKGF